MLQVPPIFEKKTTDFISIDSKGGKRRLDALLHLHYHVEIVCMLKGKTTAITDSDEYTLTAGDVFVTFPNQVHSYVSEADEDYYLFIINPDLIPEISFECGFPKSSVIKGAMENEEIASIARALAALRKDDEHPMRDQLIKGYLLAFFGHIFPLFDFLSPSNVDSRATREIIGYCSAHYCEPLSLDVLQNELHLSKYYISHLFSGKLGVSFNDYINSLRISHACRLLRREDTPITQIAGEVGFSTLRTFNRAFARYKGMTPSEYRRRSEKKNEAASMLPVFDK